MFFGWYPVNYPKLENLRLANLGNSPKRRAYVVAYGREAKLKASSLSLALQHPAQPPTTNWRQRIKSQHTHPEAYYPQATVVKLSLHPLSGHPLHTRHSTPPTVLPKKKTR
jgi:hypothetical protein